MEELLHQLSYGLYVVSTARDNKSNACIINTAFQLTVKPLQICISLNKDHLTTEMIEKSQNFILCPLLKEGSQETIEQFGYQSGRKGDKFKGIETKESHGILYPIKGIGSEAFYEVTKTVDVGTHLIFIATLQDGEIVSNQNLLIYAEYLSQKKKVSPKVNKGYVCDVCGFVYEEDTLPPDYICPVCHVDASHFKPLD